MAGPLQNYMMYTGGAGIYSYTFEYERKETCPACGSNLLRLSMPASATLEQLIERLMSDSTMYVLVWLRDRSGGSRFQRVLTHAVGLAGASTGK